MYIAYPVRNFRCPFCGARMPTETYKGWQPWKCPDCARDLQFSEAYGWIVQLVFFLFSLSSLYFFGFRGWQLFGAAIVAAFALTVLFVGPLHRVIPPRLEAYRPPPWKENKYLTLFPGEHADSCDEPRESNPVEDSSPKSS